MKERIQITISLLLCFTLGAACHYYYTNLTIYFRLLEEFGRQVNTSNIISVEATNPNLPTILLIGDSISAGYFAPLKRILDGKVVVQRILDNARDTQYTLKNLHSWLNKYESIDLILFNNGLHDLKHFDNKGKLTDSKNGVLSVDIQSYKKNMIQIVSILKKTNARLVFATTTPIPNKALGWTSGNEVEYNYVAKEIMKNNGVAICDLYSIALPILPITQLDTNIHPNAIGSWILATAASSVILDEISH